jgi:hypothetical protein
MALTGALWGFVRAACRQGSSYTLAVIHRAFRFNKGLILLFSLSLRLESLFIFSSLGVVCIPHSTMRDS